MPLIFLDHLVVNGHTEILPYTSTSSGRTKVIPRTGLDRVEQGESIRQQFNNAVEIFRSEGDSDFVYLVFTSPRGFY